MKDSVTESRITYNTRSGKSHKWSLEMYQKTNFELPAIKTVFYILESVRYLGPKVWKLVPDELKEITFFL